MYCTECVLVGGLFSVGLHCQLTRTQRKSYESKRTARRLLSVNAIQHMIGK